MTYEPQKLLGCQTSPRTREARRPSWGETAPGQGGRGAAFKGWRFLLKERSVDFLSHQPIVVRLGHYSLSAL